MSLAHRLAAWVEQTSFDQLPPRVVEASKEMMVNAAAVGLAGAAQPDGLALTRFAQEMRGSGKCTIIGMGLRSSPTYSSLANGAMIRLLDFDDEMPHGAGAGYNGGVHPSSVVFPVVMALGEMHGYPGAEVLNAFALGCELLCKLSTSSAGETGLGTASAGSVAAAAAAGRLLGLEQDQLASALVIAAQSATAASVGYGLQTTSPDLGPQTASPDPGPPQPLFPLHPTRHSRESGNLSPAVAARSGQSAMNGVAAALLAQEDFGRNSLGLAPSGADAESGSYDRFFASLAAPYSVEDPGIVLKPFACNTDAHASIDAVLQLAQQYRPLQTHSAAEVESVRVEAPPAAVEALANANPRNGWEARQSLKYVVAASLLYGHPLIEQFSDAAVTAPEVRALMDRITVSPLREPTPFAPQTSEVSVTLTGGREAEAGRGDMRVLHHRVEFPRGHPQVPLEREELDAKFLYCSRYILPPDHIEGALEQFWDLEHVADITGLASILGG